MGFSASQMASASLTGQISGVATSAIGSYFNAATQKSNLQAQAELQQVNARLSELSARDALDQGRSQVAALTLQAGQLKGRQRASLAANGVDLGVGSAAEILASTDVMKEIDRDTAMQNALKTAWGFRAQATNYQIDATLKKASAQGISPMMAGATTLIGGASQVAPHWLQLDQSGALDGTIFQLR